MAELGETLLSRTRYAQQQLAAIGGIRLTDSALHLREFEIDVAGAGRSAQGIVDALRTQGIEPGVVTGASTLLVCVTVLTSQLDIDRLAEAVRRSPKPPPTRPRRRSA